MSSEDPEGHYGLFSDWLSKPVLDAVIHAGYETPSPIHAFIRITKIETVGTAQTGTGKTAAFTLPLLSRLKFSANGSPAMRLTCSSSLFKWQKRSIVCN